MRLGDDDLRNRKRGGHGGTINAFPCGHARDSVNAVSDGKGIIRCRACRARLKREQRQRQEPAIAQKAYKRANELNMQAMYNIGSKFWACIVLYNWVIWTSYEGDASIFEVVGPVGKTNDR